MKIVKQYLFKKKFKQDVINPLYHLNLNASVCISSYLYKKEGTERQHPVKMCFPFSLFSHFLRTNHGFLRNVKYSRYNFKKKSANKIPRLTYAKNSFIIWCAKKRITNKCIIVSVSVQTVYILQ